MNTKRTGATALLTLAAAGLTGCGTSGDNTSPKDSGAGSTSSRNTDLAVADSGLGKIVVDGTQLTAYFFTKDTPNSGSSACTGPCEKLWPPISATSTTPTVKGITGTVGAITRSDGTRQVTVDGRPVYHYAKDSKTGDISGQGVGGIWYVLRPDGTMITDAAPGSAGY